MSDISKNSKGLVPRLRFPEFRDAGAWEEKTLGSCLDYLQPTKYLVSSTDYNDKHNIPVLTAGKTFILGYTNETKGIFRKDLPVIIFDDFTTASKFVDFPFKAKSSAMKILLAKEGASIKFVYESMQMIRYEVGVHERHWISIFSNLTIPVPSHYDEQQKIADFLSSLDELIRLHGQKLDALKAHKKGLMQQLFPREGETVPRLRFPEFWDAGVWEEKRLGECLYRKPEYGVNAPAVPYSMNLPAYLRITDITEDGRFLESTRVSVDIDATEEKYLLLGDIVLARTGASVGKSYQYREEDGRLVFAGFLIRVRPNPPKT